MRLRLLALLLLTVLLPVGVWGQTSSINSNVVIIGHVNTCTTGPSGTTGNAYACTLGYAITSYIDKACYSFRADVASTGSSSLNLHSLGAKTISKVVGGVTTALAANDIRVGHLVRVCYDQTNDRMQCQNCDGNAPAFTDLIGSASDAQIPNLNTLSTGLTTSRCVETDGSGALVSAAALCGSGGGGVTTDTAQRAAFYNSTTTVDGATGLTFSATGDTINTRVDRATAMSANLSITTADGPIIECTAGATAKTATLPTAASTTQGRIHFRKVDSGVGDCILAPNGTETINGVNGNITIDAQWGYVEVERNQAGTGWLQTGGVAGLSTRALVFELGDETATAALATTAVSYVTVPFGCNITGYALIVDAADATMRVKFWRVATGGTAKPTSANSINTAGLGVPTGTRVASTTVTDFTSTAIAANDTLAMNVSTANVAKMVSATLTCIQQ